MCYLQSLGVQVPVQTDLLTVYSLQIVQNQFNRHRSAHIPCYTLCLTIQRPRICVLYVSGELYVLQTKREPDVT